MYSSLSYLTRKAGFAQVNDHFPITQRIPNQDSPETFKGEPLIPSPQAFVASVC